MDWSSPGVSPPLSANDSPAAQGCAGNRIDPEKVTPFRWLSVARFTAELTSRWKTGKGRHASRGVPIEVPYNPFNYRMAAAIFIRVVSKHGKLTMRYWMKPLTAPPGGKG
ncbi:hypothetical protein AVEN_120506-1 [Araneus ventricosus]|uniref:Uncharacterized protein n=1 Tax=Araneus ventricosus TaxID=182803 RepID=A0A4Y2WJL9_ARAVE|nr:hypothetical protein AVEN_120506-1 [Araneus ventricosus]